MTTALILLSEWDASQVEFWKPIQGFPGYDISSKGRIRSYWIRRHRKGVIGTTPHLMRPQISVKHAGVSLRRSNNKTVRIYMHRLVAQAFLPNPNGWPEVNHITAYPADNRVDGLEWATHYGNHTHAKINGLHAQGSRNGQARLDDQQVLEIRRRLQSGEKQADLAAEFKVSQPHISGIKSRRLWGHI